MNSDFKPRFRAGDRVTCKVPTSEITEGRDYTVEDSFNDKGEEMIALVEVPGFDYFAFRFELAPDDRQRKGLKYG